ncbi:hypothetical protein LZ554_002520 [Drepanopeziza brunnea f. sp. 'monogermtubi']|nr:hypothetical protein LZ554_002520 [Drepanopeziza brunnea f. sp. 'monogermtubi']
MQFDLSTLLILATAIASINATPLPAQGQSMPEHAEILAPRTAEAALSRIKPGSVGPDGALGKRGDWTPSTGAHEVEELEDENEVEEVEEEHDEEALEKRAATFWPNLKLVDDLQSDDGQFSAGLKKTVTEGLKKSAKKGIKKGLKKGLKELAEEMLFKREVDPIPKKLDGLEFDSTFTGGVRSKFKKGVKKGVRKGFNKGVNYGVRKGIKKGAKSALKKGAKKALKKGAKKVAKKALKCYFLRFLC